MLSLLIKFLRRVYVFNLAYKSLSVYNDSCEVFLPIEPDSYLLLACKSSLYCLAYGHFGTLILPCIVEFFWCLRLLGIWSIIIPFHFVWNGFKRVSHVSTITLSTLITLSIELKAMSWSHNIKNHDKDINLIMKNNRR